MAVSLSMPLFVNPADVILRMQLGAELDGVQDVISSGIIGAQLHVQQVIDGELSRRSRECLFFLDKESFSGIQPGGTFRLEIPSGFIRTDTDIVVSATAPVTDTEQTSQFSDYTEIDTDFMRVDYDRGYLFIDAGKYANCYVKVQCDTGFEDGLTPYPTTDLDEWSVSTAYVVGDKVKSGGIAYECIVDVTGGSVTDVTKWKLAYVDLEQIPNRVYEAIMCMVPVIFDNSQQKDADAKEKYQRAADHAAIILSPYMRVGKGFTFRPL